MRCNAPSYTGKDAYVYFAYCVDDTGIAFPSVERMARSGLRVCYPDYENNFVENYSSEIEKIKNCRVMIALLTDDVISSHIVRKFLNTASKNKKPLIGIRFNDVQMSPAMNMQFEKACLFDFYNFTSDPLVQTVFGVSAIAECMGTPNPAIEIQKNIPKRHIPLVSDVSQITEETMREIEKAMKRNKNASEPSAEKPENKEIRLAPNPIEDELDKTVNADLEPPKRRDAQAVKAEKATPPLPLIVSMTTGEWKKGRLGDAVVGRKKNAETDGDITFTDSCRAFSGKHFQLIYMDGIRKIVSLHANGMSVNGKQLEKDERIPLTQSVSNIVIPNLRTLNSRRDMDIRPAVFAVAFESDAYEIEKAGRLASLTSLETEETRFFHGETFLLGKNNPWGTGALSSKTISKMHATISFKEGACEVEVHSSNGLYVNEQFVRKNERTMLKSGDTLMFPGNAQMGIPSETVVYRMVMLQKEG